MNDEVAPLAQRLQEDVRGRRLQERLDLRPLVRMTLQIVR
ncbi:hypothetical protein Y023_5126 [Burkholderia pseudomallei A79D]|nr:hypothetical protein Y023_5126 [Burkholderia pseudomallei A79D]KGX97318.1 hypothetical protein X997_4809 [Burkholderia pseudomallei A79C]